MKRRQAEKIIKNLVHGRSYTAWPKHTLLAAVSKVYGGHDARSKVGYLLFMRIAGDIDRVVDAFGKVSKAFNEATAALQKFNQETDMELAS